jgi:hypothetical protein
VSVAARSEELEPGQPLELPEPIELEMPELAPQATPGPAEATALADLAQATLDAGASSLAAAAPTPTSGPLGIGAALPGGGQGDAGRSRRGGAADLAKIGGQFFGVGAGGNFFCYVVDSSGSMRGEAWLAAKSELLRSLSTLSERQRFLIVFFAEEIAAIPEPGERTPAQRGLTATPQNIDHARRWIETIKISRGGPPNDALGWAIEREPDAIYLLTDGVTKTDVCTFLRTRNRISDFISGDQVRVPIHAIAYHSLDGQQLLRQIAEENKGQFHYVPAPRR